MKNPVKNKAVLDGVRPIAGPERVFAVMPCPLCGASPSRRLPARTRTLLKCGVCFLVYAERSELLPRERLKERYLFHENGIENEGYRAFLSRVIDAARPYLSPGARGLDFGCGPGPVLSTLAGREGLVMTDYDPIFCDVPLNPPYEVIFSTECFEHFEEPARDIARVSALLGEGGILCIMTELWSETTDFGEWYYAADPTHVSFYSQETLDHVCRMFGLRRLAGDGKRVFIFSKKSG